MNGLENLIGFQKLDNLLLLYQNKPNNYLGELECFEKGIWILSIIVFSIFGGISGISREIFQWKIFVNFVSF